MTVCLFEKNTNKEFEILYLLRIKNYWWVRDKLGCHLQTRFVSIKHDNYISLCRSDVLSYIIRVRNNQLYEIIAPEGLPSESTDIWTQYKSNSCLVSRSVK